MISLKYEMKHYFATGFKFPSQLTQKAKRINKLWTKNE